MRREIQMRICIIGGGPSGLMCALKAAENPKHRVFVIEKNEKAGKKIYITGKGRCNVTNCCSEREFIENVVTNAKFLYSAIHRFSSEDAMSFFEENGVRLVVERGNRVFPASYRASDITKALLKRCEMNGVRFFYREKAEKIEKTGGVFSVETDRTSYIADAVVIASGGKSYPLTGSTGDGYRFARAFGLEVVSPVPALVPLKIKGILPEKAREITLKNVNLKAIVKETGKILTEEFGELLLEKNALGGPIALTISSRINREKKTSLALELDFKPSLDEETLKKRIQRDIDAMKKRKNAMVFYLLRGLIPEGLIDLIARDSALDTRSEISSVEEEHISRLIRTLKHYRWDFDGTESFDRAIITSGGISVGEIRPRTMESKDISGLYFVGETLDVDAYTGGFNMQIALSTGYCAGTDLREKS